VAVARKKIGQIIQL